MFVLERYLRSRKLAQEKWHADAEAWVTEKNNNSYRSNYSKRDYAMHYPRPRDVVYEWLKYAPIAIGILTVVSMVVWAIIGSVNSHNETVNIGHTKTQPSSRSR